MTRSTTAEREGIRNTPNHEQTQNIYKLIDNCLQPIRDKWGSPIGVNSGFRSKELNRAVGGVLTSQHLKGEAADITTGTVMGNKRLFEMIVGGDFEFDQIIDEKNFRWIHISYREGSNRHQILHL